MSCFIYEWFLFQFSGNINIFFLSQLLIKMSSLSLNASIRTCKVETGEASRMESDRFLNPMLNVCIPWGQMNNKGQYVSADSFFTKTRGCNSAMDRVSVENNLRPDYATYINLDISGLNGHMYENNPTAWTKSGEANEYTRSRDNIGPSYGNQFNSSNQKTCGFNAYENAMAQTSQSNRQASFQNNAYQQNQYQQHAGNRSCGGGY
jgi:hypothetical protein